MVAAIRGVTPEISRSRIVTEDSWGWGKKVV
jgi:hypothetical protein